MNAEQLEAHRAAEAADAAFHAELVRQFGAKNAGDARYDSKKHDARTARARFVYRMALDAKRRADFAATKTA